VRRIELAVTRTLVPTGTKANCYESRYRVCWTYCSPPSGLRVALAGLFSLMSSQPIRVAVFIDWQNTYMTAREAFGWKQFPSEHGTYSPYTLARIIAAGNGRGETGRLVSVDIFRGQPSQRYDRIGYAANRRQAAAWERENPSCIHVHQRPLRYDPHTRVPTEKGVDVQLAVSAVEATLTKTCDVAVIFTHDTDLLPAVELIARLGGAAHVETASWISDSFVSRLRTPLRIYHHAISEAVFERVETLVNYAHPKT
jgi:uncharacterized LabA/DUF88 family protein